MSAAPRESPVVLVDWPDDGMDELGWVESIVDVEAALKLIRPMSMDPDLYEVRLDPATPTVHLRPTADDVDLWEECAEDDPAGRAFWRFEAVDRYDGGQEATHDA